MSSRQTGVNRTPPGNGLPPCLSSRSVACVTWLASGGPPTPLESEERADEGTYRRRRFWGAGRGRSSRPQRGDAWDGYHDLRGGRAVGRRILSRRQRGEWLQPAGLPL